MELPVVIAVGQAPAQQPAPPPAMPDGRAPADASATTKDPSPEVPLPVSASPTQSGFVSKAALGNSDAALKLDTSGVSPAQRTLKPYGINILPEKQDTPKQEAAPENQAK
ncbi:hypothetical protein OAN307_c12760 [Octadecabacter antarcticus 307]|uniref:Uncharacterized protein n=1 Tax=Octadecabacter antarcticus 307 TaxID=391626 RepID=M9RB23_9RHOB|nr:hypothetical protein [Octadecabacter antarcticus]AGI66970.1 hypothetical protein OAN307_c12760 [Octadecabacter antarcticus 307]